MTDVNILKTGNDLLIFISKRWWVILLCLIIGLAIGYFRRTNTPPIYETELVGEAYNISNVAVVGVINTLKSSANSNNYIRLTAQTHILQEVTKSIYALEAKIFKNTNPTENLNNNVFYVRIRTSDLTQTPNFIDGLEHFINNNVLFKEKGKVIISTQFDLPTKPVNSLITSLIKYGIVFFVLGIVISILISFYFNIKVYQKANNA